MPRRRAEREHQGVTNPPKFTLPLALAVAATSLVLTGSGPAHADPDLDTARKQLDAIYAKAEVASERVNTARVDLKASKVRLKALRHDVRSQQKVVDAMREQVTAMVVDQYQGGALSTASRVVFADNPDAFLNNLNAVSSYNTQRTEVMQEYSAELRELQLRQDAADEEVQSRADLFGELDDQKRELDSKAAEAKALVDRLESEQLDALMAGDLEVPPNLPASGRAKIAIRYALAQIGDAYVWGAAGPNAFDCSGLTMAAWGQAGVSLPHSSRAQTGSGPRVSRDNLQPGDLVFYYSPVSHVAIYLGGGKIVHAAHPGAGVRVDGVFSMPFAGAVRPG